MESLESKSTIHPNSEEIESPWIVTAAMKLKDTCSLEKKLWPTQTAYYKAQALLFLQKSV